jgi:uncharacterized membrane protein YqiK
MKELQIPDARKHEIAGWRAGRPLEDPEKIKRWGFVSAKPSEFLVHARRGELTSRSGQGSSCFKWPWDAVAVVPTSLQRLSFVADQVTAEKVGVEVRGFAVYRIADPVLAYRVLNFSYPERAQEKLEETLTAMFVGATRRIVATLGIEDCLRRRKAVLAEELLREIAPVIGGAGRAEDTTERGWGVVLDTIEIQEVRVLSETVFAALQAPFRAELERRAREARAESGRAVAEREAHCRREVELAKLRTDAELDAERAEATRRRTEREATLEEERRALEQRALEAAAARAVRATELEAAKAQAELEAHERRLAAERATVEIERLRAEVEAEIGRARAVTQRDQGLAEAEVALRNAEAERLRAEANARRELARQLPALAAAVGQRIGEVRVTQIGAAENPFSQVAGALAAVVDLARRA